MNKKYISLAIGFIVLIGIVFGVREYLLHKEVIITMSEGIDEVAIYNADNRSVALISESQTISLKEGEYSYRVFDEQYTDEPASFVVSNTTNVEVAPFYSEKYLDSQIETERSLTQGLITRTYIGEIDDYVIGDEKLHHYGDWYSAKLIQKVSGGNQPDVYRVILQKEDDVWKIVASPELIISSVTYPDIPKDIITQVNEPLSIAAYDLIYP